MHCSAAETAIAHAAERDHRCRMDDAIACIRLVRDARGALRHSPRGKRPEWVRELAHRRNR